MNQFPAGCTGSVRIAVTAVVADVDDGRPGRAGPAEQILDRRPDRIRVRDRLGRLQHVLLHIDEQQDGCHGPIVEEGGDNKEVRRPAPRIQDSFSAMKSPGKPTRKLAAASSRRAYRAHLAR